MELPLPASARVLRRSAAGLSLALALAVSCTQSLPSEKWMRAHWKQHRAELEQLVRMSNQDFQAQRVTRITQRFIWRSDNWLWPRPESEWGLTQARWDQYKALFSRLKLSNGLDRAGPEHAAIVLALRGAGVAGGGDEYGYVWASKRPMPVDAKGQTFTVKPLEDNWYLYRWQVDQAELKKSTSTRFSSDLDNK